MFGNLRCGPDSNRHLIPWPQARATHKWKVLIGGWDPIPTSDSTAAVILFFPEGTNDPRITKFYLKVPPFGMQRCFHRCAAAALRREQCF